MCIIIPSGVLCNKYKFFLGFFISFATTPLIFMSPIKYFFFPKHCPKHRPPLPTTIFPILASPIARAESIETINGFVYFLPMQFITFSILQLLTVLSKSPIISTFFSSLNFLFNFDPTIGPNASPIILSVPNT